MARNNRAKKPKKKMSTKEQLEALLKQLSKETGHKMICITEEDVEEIKMDVIRTTMKCSSSLLEYNMIVDNKLSSAEAKRQRNLMDTRAEAIINGFLTWEEIEAFLDEYHAKEEADAKL